MGMLYNHRKKIAKKRQHCNSNGSEIIALLWNVKHTGNSCFSSNLYTLVGKSKQKLLVINGENALDESNYNLTRALGYENIASKLSNESMFDTFHVLWNPTVILVESKASYVNMVHPQCCMFM